jgi:MoaD family protein
MIKVNVRYFNILAAYAGIRKQIVELKEGTTIFDLILQVSQSNPPAFQEVILQDGAPSPHLRVFHNNLPVNRDSLDTALKDGDEILLFPAVAGGARLSLAFISTVTKEI